MNESISNISREGKYNISHGRVRLAEQTDSITTIVNSASSLVKDIDILVCQLSAENSPKTKYAESTAKSHFRKFTDEYLQRKFTKE